MKAKTKLTRLWSFLLALVMVVGMLPTMSLTAYAEDTTSINEVYLTYDTSKIILNTAYTEGEVDTLIRNNISSATIGVSVDRGNSGLRFLDGTTLNGISDGKGQITEGRTYLVRYNLEVASGYDWADKSNTTSIKFYLNGTEATPYKTEYNSYWNSYNVYYTLGTPTTDPIVKSVSINQSDVSVQVGNSYNFTATVAGNVLDKTVKWSVSGANSGDTKISDEGVLSVGSDETANSVTVTATSNADSSKSASQPVTITAAPLTIDSVTVSPSSKELYTGNTCSFTVTVTGTENDKSVTWSVTGQTSASTAITSDGTLTVGNDEAAENITVKAESNADPTKYGEASITIKQTVFIDNVSLTYDASKVNLNTAYTEGEVKTLIRNNISSETIGVSVDLGNSGLFYLDGTTINGIGDGTGQITEGRTYLVKYNLKVISGYDWADKSNTTAIKFYLNGTETTPYKTEYNSYWNSYVVYFTLGTPHTHTFDQETIKDEALKTPADCTNNAVYYKSCSCGEISTNDTDTFTITDSALGHSFTNYVSNNNATCTSNATETATCDRADCDVTDTREIADSALGHSYVSTVVPANCTTQGYTTYTCSVCGDSYNEDYTDALGHSFGENNATCTVCGVANPNYVAPTQPTTQAPTTTQPTTQAQPTTQPTAQQETTTTTAAAEETTAKPKATSIKKLTKGKKSFKATWKKITGVNGYQIQYSTDNKFKKNTKTATIKKNTASATIKKLKANKKYYVRVRSYKNAKVGGKTVKVYSSWSKVKTVKTK